MKIQIQEAVEQMMEGVNNEEELALVLRTIAKFTKASKTMGHPGFQGEKIPQIISTLLDLQLPPAPSL